MRFRASESFLLCVDEVKEGRKGGRGGQMHAPAARGRRSARSACSTRRTCKTPHHTNKGPISVPASVFRVGHSLLTTLRKAMKACGCVCGTVGKSLLAEAADEELQRRPCHVTAHAHTSAHSIAAQPRIKDRHGWGCDPLHPHTASQVGGSNPSRCSLISRLKTNLIWSEKWSYRRRGWRARPRRRPQSRCRPGPSP